MNQIKITILLSTVLMMGFLSCQKKKADTHEHNHTDTTTAVVVDTVKKSIPKEEHVMVGDAHLTIKYHAPAVRGRVIWGGLVPYEQVWVTGAHRATSFECNKDFLVAGKKVPAGKYAIFTIPGKEKWILIFNKKWDQHLADEYDQKDDVIRVEVTPTITETNQERLRYSVTDVEDKTAKLNIRWEKVLVSVPLAFE